MNHVSSSSEESESEREFGSDISDTDVSEVWDENSQGNENNDVGNTDVPGNSITLRRSHRTGPHVNYAELADEMESNEE